MNYPALDPSLLQAFVAVADQRSFTRAANALNRTQSAVSTQIKRLEAQVGVRLLHRTTNHVELSPAGESLIGYARRILSLGDEAVRRLREHELEGAVRLGVMDDYGSVILPELLKTFSLAYPRVQVEMETGLTAGMAERLGRDFDLVIAMHGAGEGGGVLLRQEQAVWAGDAGARAWSRNPLPAALYPSGCLFRQWALEALDRAGRPWRLAFVSHSLSAVAAVAAQGLAVTVVKEGVAPAGLAILGEAEGLPPLPRADIRLHAAPALSPAGRLLAEHLQDYWRRAGVNLPARLAPAADRS